MTSHLSLFAAVAALHLEPAPAPEPPAATPTAGRSLHAELLRLLDPDHRLASAPTVHQETS